MVKILLLCVGRLKEDAERGFVDRYIDRFHKLGARHGLGVGMIYEMPESQAPTPKERKAAEAAELRQKIGRKTPLMALDERGASLTSVEFAQKLAAWRDDGVKELAVVIGGPDGLDPDLVKNAQLVLSLGRLTLPHGLARVVLAEQFYRAVTILAGHPYHRA